MNNVFLFFACLVVVLALTVFSILACGIDRIKPPPSPPAPPKPKGRPAAPLARATNRQLRRHQARTRLGELLRCSHPEWN